MATISPISIMRANLIERLRRATERAPSAPSQMCSTCRKLKAPTEFYQSSASVRLHYECKECCNAKSRAFARQNPEKRKRYKRASLMRQYGLQSDDYDWLFILQDGVCAICHGPGRNGEALHIDHDHKTGAVRGLLCGQCNMKLAWYEERGEAAGQYLLHPPASSLTDDTLLQPKGVA